MAWLKDPSDLQLGFSASGSALRCATKILELQYASLTTAQLVNINLMAPVGGIQGGQRAHGPASDDDDFLLLRHYWMR